MFLAEALSYEEHDRDEVRHDNGCRANADDRSEGCGGPNVDETEKCNHNAHKTDSPERNMGPGIDLRT